MKRLNLVWVALTVVALLSACNQEPKDVYVVKGQIAGNLPPELPYVYLRAVQNQDMVVLDSVQLSANGSFELVGSVEQAKVAYLSSEILKGLRRSVPIFLQNKTQVNFSMHLDSMPEYQAKGNTAQDMYADYQAEVQKYDAIWQNYYYNTFNKMTKEEQAANESYLDSLYDESVAQRKSYVSNLINNNLNNIASPYILLMEENTLSEDDMLALSSKLSAETIATDMGKDLNERVEVIKNTQIGKAFVNFSMQDANGNMVNLMEVVKGKVVLLDFWASWCAPCRAENPNVLANYNKYHEKGFDIVGISLDEKKDSWLKAIEKDGLTWLHLSDLKGWKCAAAKLYGVRSIPQNVLLDQNGVIIAKNLRGEELGAKLKELYK